jgi:hypothetical protein
MIKLGIYGYECTVDLVFDHFSIHALNRDFTEAQKLAADPSGYHLTAILDIHNENNSRELVHDLEGVLSFIDHKDVLITNKLREHESQDNLDTDYPMKLTGFIRHNGGGKVIMSDAFSKGSRHQFISFALKKLNDTSCCFTETFRCSFFKTIEVFRAKECFVDVSYYLLFSALESLARCVLNDYKSKNSATPITRFLNKYEFLVEQENLTEPFISITTYVELRNALFHNGLFEATFSRNNTEYTYKLAEYYSPFNRLVSLVLMKYIGFDDGYINWNSWLDRQQFKSRI